MGIRCPDSLTEVSGLHFSEGELLVSRFRSLDGLRGLAAVVVIAYHATLINPTFAAIILQGVRPPSTVWNTLVYSPVRIFVAGGPAVIVFFVLSGFVLTLQVRRATNWDWQGYFPRRLVRLFLPAAGSVVLAVILGLAVFRDAQTNPSAWVQSYTFVGFDYRKPLQALDLFDGNPDFNSPLWSLRWEVLFSLLLPVYVWIVARGRRVTAIALAAVPILVFIGWDSGDATLQYLPCFFVGSALTVLLGPVDNPSPAVMRWPRELAWIAVCLLSLLLLVLGSITAPGLASAPHLAHAANATVVIGAAGIVVVACRWRPAIRLLSTPLFAWLGRISFSLYLVHVPILIATGNVLADLPWPASLIIGVAIAFGVGELFSRLVERPSHRLSQRIGRSRGTVNADATS